MIQHNKHLVTSLFSLVSTKTFKMPSAVLSKDLHIEETEAEALNTSDSRTGGTLGDLKSINYELSEKVFFS